jgi:hypothetical protein
MVPLVPAEETKRASDWNQSWWHCASSEHYPSCCSGAQLQNAEKRNMLLHTFAPQKVSVTWGKPELYWAGLELTPFNTSFLPRAASAGSFPSCDGKSKFPDGKRGQQGLDGLWVPISGMLRVPPFPEKLTSSYGRDSFLSPVCSSTP